MQIQWLQLTLNYWNKLVANKADSEMLDFVLAAEVWQGLHKDHDCWAKELLEGLRFQTTSCGPQQRLADPHAAADAN
jgi:hypothetical protein